MTVDCYDKTEENTSCSYGHPRRNGIFKHCNFCGALIVLTLFELAEIQNPQDWMYWKRVPIKKWWLAFDADQPNQKHSCKQQKQGAAV